MCHVLDFRPRFNALPLTLDVADLLLTKLQIVELNKKDARDIVHLLSAFTLVNVPSSSGAVGIDAARFSKVVGADWGWWRTVTDNLTKLPALVAEKPDLLPDTARHDPLEIAK